MTSLRPGDDVARETKASWWKGKRGEWYVLVQAVLMLLVLAGPRTPPGGPDWSPPFAPLRQVIGAILVVAGGGFFVAGLHRLGSALTPLPYPKEGAALVRTGPFALVRHPIYSGGLIASSGIALMVSGWLTLVYVAALFVLLDIKSRKEERWLVQKFPEYRDYRRRVRKLVPFVY
jgi:protein-S-isoprenylcysteine O-methyltransferase Ste14